MPRSPQGHPVLIQAGQSGRGRSFAGRWGELIFVVYPNLAAGQKQYRDLKDAVAAAGRDPNSVSVCPACYVVVGDSQAAAEEQREYLRALAKPVDAVVLLSEALNFDFASKDPDSEFSDEDLKRLSWSGFRDRVVALSGKPNPTVRDFVHFSGRGTIGEFPIFCGTAKTVADQMEEWFEGGACDGFVLAATHTPGAFEDFTRYVVPELQRRGLYHKDYAGTTLRENLGLKRPLAGDWRKEGRPS